MGVSYEPQLIYQFSEGVCDKRVGVSYEPQLIFQFSEGVCDKRVGVSYEPQLIFQFSEGVCDKRVGVSYEPQLIFHINRPGDKGTAVPIGVNLSDNPCKISFPGSTWKCIQGGSAAFAGGGAS